MRLIGGHATGPSNHAIKKRFKAAVPCSQALKSDLGAIHCAGVNSERKAASSGRHARHEPTANTSVYTLPEKSGIYHFLINFSSGMGEWYMKVVFESFDSFQLAEFDFSFCVSRTNKSTLTALVRTAL